MFFASFQHRNIAAASTAALNLTAGLEGKGTQWQPGDGALSVTPVFGLTLRGELPVAEKCSLGLEASGRHWTRRTTIENPMTIGGNGVASSAAGTNEGVRMGQDSASELGAALRLSYSFSFFPP